MSVELGRPLAATLLLGAMLALAGLSLGAEWIDLSAAEEEQQVKSEFVSHGFDASRRGAVLAETKAASLLIEADSETLAAARIDALIRATAAEAGGSVLSSRAEAKHEEADLGGRIEVQAVIEGQNDVLQDILLRLESGAPMMLVDDLAVQPAATASGGTGDDKAPQLHAEVTLSAYWQQPKR